MSRLTEEEQELRANEMYRLATVHPSEIDPTSIKDWAVAGRIAAAATKLQCHECSSYCLTRKISPAECRQKGYDPKTMNMSELTKEQLNEFMKCSKGFPKAVAEREENRMRADPRVSFEGLLKYNPCRDDKYVNNYNPVMLFVWGANMDMQVLHQSGT